MLELLIRLTDQHFIFTFIMETCVNFPYDRAFAEISRCDDSMKTTLAVECAVRELIDRGYIEMAKPIATPRGVAIYDQLRAHGFVPDREYARECLKRHYGGDWRLLAKMVFKLWDEEVRDSGAQTSRDHSGGDVSAGETGEFTVEFPLFFLCRDASVLLADKTIVPMWTDEDAADRFVERSKGCLGQLSLVEITSDAELLDLLTRMQESGIEQVVCDVASTNQNAAQGVCIHDLCAMLRERIR